jgi:hypothetical protein
MSTSKLVLAASVLCLAGMSAPAAFAGDAIGAAMDACTAMTDRHRQECEVHVMSLKYSADAAASGKSGTIHFDFNDSDDSDAVKAAKATLYESLQTCDTSGGGQLTQCHMDAFDVYQQAIGG